ncbi:MAG: carboxyltransferase domain-containing protein [Bacteroidota bacterium]
MASRFIHLNNLKFRASWIGPTLLLLHPEPQKGSQALIPNMGLHIRQQYLEPIQEVVATPHEIALLLKHPAPKILDQLADISFLSFTEAKRHYVLPVCFEKGTDWTFVCEHTLLAKDAVIDQLLQTTFSLSMWGFLPGFLYLDNLPEQLHCPRKTHPAKQVPRGSLAIGGKYLGLYGLASPGGWHVIGNCPLVSFQSDQVPPMKCAPGDTFSLTKISEATWLELRDQQLSLSSYAP